MNLFQSGMTHLNRKMIGPFDPTTVVEANKQPLVPKIEGTGRSGKSVHPGNFHIAHENRPSQKESSLPTIIFSGAMLNCAGII